MQVTKQKREALPSSRESKSEVQAEILQGALKKAHMGFPGGPWIRLYVPNARGMGLIPHQRTRSPLPQLKSLHDKTKTLGNQINKYKHFLKKKRPTWQKTCLKQPSILGKTKPAQKGSTPFISSSLSHSSLWPDPWSHPGQPAGGLQMRKKKSNASFLLWRLQAWGSDEMLPWNQVQGVHYHPGLDIDLWNKTVCNSL